MLQENTLLYKRYRITRLLGKGGFGAVYEAIDETFDQPIALKEIHLLAKISDESQKRLVLKAFKSEAKALAKARHESIPYVRDYFSENDEQYLVMELVEGDELAELLENRKKPFPLEDVLNWTDQLLDVLDYLHTLKPPIIHRDIKPSNLKLTSRGKVKLLDFGIAKVVETKTNLEIAQKTIVGATENFAPIEQLLHAIEKMSREYFRLKHKEKTETILGQKTDVRCDIYAVGATMYSLLTNQMPLDSAKRAMEIWESNLDPLTNPSEVNTQIPSEISDFILKSMEIERENRFKSALEMKETLQEIIHRKKRLIEEAEQKYWKDKQNKLQEESEKLEIEREEYIKQIKEENLRKEKLEEEEKRAKKEKFLNQAKTDRLIQIDESNMETEKEIFPFTLPLPIETLNTQPSDTFSSVEITPTDYKLSDADISANYTSDGQSYIDEDFLNKQKETSSKSENVEIMPLKSDDSSTDNRIFLALPIIGILSLAVFGGGIFGIISWMNYSGNSTENNSTIENTNLEKTAEVTPTIEANFNTSEANTNINTEMTSDTTDEPKKDKPKPTVQPISKPIIKQTPQPTPTKKPPIKKTPTPKPTKAPVTADDLMNDN